MMNELIDYLKEETIMQPSNQDNAVSQTPTEQQPVQHPTLEERVAMLEAELAQLRDEVRRNTLAATSYTRDASILPGP